MLLDCIRQIANHKVNVVYVSFYLSRPRLGGAVAFKMTRLPQGYSDSIWVHSKQVHISALQPLTNALRALGTSHAPFASEPSIRH